MKSGAVAISEPVILGILSLVFVAGCGGGTSRSSNNQAVPPSGSNPTPTITTISPNSTVAGGAAFTLTINGTNFVAASMVNFGGAAPTTTFVSATQLTAAIPAAAIASAGTLAVTVTNPTPGGGTSNTVSFAINSGTNPIPTISSLDPSCAPVGAQAFALAVTGTNFVPSSVIRWNGSDRPTTVGSTNGTLLLAQIPGSDIAAVGTAAVTVFNPAPGGGSSTSSTFTVTAGGVNPQSVAMDPTGKFAYVANGGCAEAFVGNVSMYTIDPTTGALTSIGPPVPADFCPMSIAVDPTDKFVYVANEGCGEGGSVSMYTINPTTGALTPNGRIDVFGSTLSPSSVTVDPSGRFAYVANSGGLTPAVSVYSIDATTGKLTSIGTVDAGGFVLSVAVHPSGNFAYATAAPSGSAAHVSMYTLNATTGALTPIGTIDTGRNPVSLAVSGKFAYVANSGSNDVSMYSINSTTGALTSIRPIAAGTNPSSVAVDPAGKFAYVANSGSNDVSMYNINGTTGVLSPVGRIAAGATPRSVAVHSSGRFAYVTNSGSNNVSMYSVDAATGVLTLIGTIGT